MVRRALRRFDGRPRRPHFADKTSEAWRISISQAGLILASIALMLINHSRKLLSLMIPVGVWVTGCVAASAAPQAESQEQDSAIAEVATATIANMLPVDGCSYPVTIDGVDYAPDPASLAAIRDRVPGGGTLTVRINYRVTGGTGQVQCGFGATRELPEIAFRVLRVESGLEDPTPTT